MHGLVSCIIVAFLVSFPYSFLFFQKARTTVMTDITSNTPPLQGAATSIMTNDGNDSTTQTPAGHAPVTQTATTSTTDTAISEARKSRLVTVPSTEVGPTVGGGQPAITTRRNIKPSIRRVTIAVSFSLFFNFF